MCRAKLNNRILFISKLFIINGIRIFLIFDSSRWKGREIASIHVFGIVEIPILGFFEGENFCHFYGLKQSDNQGFAALCLTRLDNLILIYRFELRKG